MSQSYTEFLNALQLAESLLRIEATYPDPAPDQDRKAAEALRGGAAVLMVAAFENFLKDLVEEHLDELTHFPLRFKAENLPQDMLFHNWEHLVMATTRRKNTEKIKAYAEMAKIIVSGVIYPSSFTDAVRSNPSSQKLGELFSRFGLRDFFKTIKTDFDSQWSNPTANTFIEDYLPKFCPN